MRKIILILSVISLGISAEAQETYLSREAYRDKVEAYSQQLKQQRLKAAASTEARKIAQTGFLPKIDITAEGTANLSHLDAWNSPAGQYRPYTYQALATLGQPLYTGGSLIAQKRIAKADEELDKLAIELTLDQIHYQSDAVYWNASAALATLEAAARFEEIVNRQYSIIQDRFDDGAISRTDLLMISTRKKEAELQFIKARQNHTLALQRLNILMGVKPDAAVDSLCEIGAGSPPIDLLSLDEVLGRRADYAGTNVSIVKSEAQGCPQPVQSPTQYVFGYRMGYRYRLYGTGRTPHPHCGAQSQHPHFPMGGTLQDQPPAKSIYRYPEITAKLCSR